jgi:hypothetical protein
MKYSNSLFQINIIKAVYLFLGTYVLGCVNFVLDINLFRERRENVLVVLVIVSYFLRSFKREIVTLSLMLRFNGAQHSGTVFTR